MTKNTPGPWDWYGNRNGVYLATPNRGHLIVMDFVRNGLQSAVPRFAIWKGEERERMGGLMKRADEIDLSQHPDARLIKAAPDLLAACEALIRATREPEMQSIGFDEEPSYATAEDHELARAIFEARAAIAKAKGQPT